MAVFKLFRLAGAASQRPRPRSWGWRAVKRAHLRKFPACAVCGSTRAVTAHHVVPVSVDPSLELVPSNLLSLCESNTPGFNCHLLVGHGGHWHAYNPNAVRDADHLRRFLSNRDHRSAR